MTSEQIEARLAQLRSEQANAVAQVEHFRRLVDTYAGAIQESERWLALLAEGEPEAPAE